MKLRTGKPRKNWLRWILFWQPGGWLWEMTRCDHARRCCNFCWRCDPSCGSSGRGR